MRPTDHAYDLTIRIRSPRPYTRRGLEYLANWWVFVKDRQVQVIRAEVQPRDTPTKGKERQ